MPLKKSELYSSLWAGADELRGGMDASQYKDYVLTLLFVKYVSDKFAASPDAQIVVPPGGGFADMVALKGKKDIGDGINKILGRLAAANGLKGVIDRTDFNDDERLGKGQEMQERLTKLIGIFENPALDFSKNRADGDDLLGDAYEYLMRNFATESGKSKGQFYTPAEVSRVMAQVIGIRHSTSKTQTLYDPTCGSGSLLLKAADEAPHGITIYGQEMDLATANLAKMNMILHNHAEAALDIHQANSLSAPYFTEETGALKRFDFVVANPPFSSKNWRTGFNPFADPFGRFDGYGVPPAKNGDYAFLLHVIRSLKSTGKGAIILPHGVLFRGNVEAEIRKNIIQRGYIKGIIGLPPNLFYGTGIAACIIVLDKEHAVARKGIFMIDASKGFMKDGNKNRLREQDIHKIVDVFNRQLEIEKYSRMVPLAEIADPKNDYNLNLTRYIDSSEPEDVQDIDAHLRGGIPAADVDALHAYWQVAPTLKNVLFANGSRAGYVETQNLASPHNLASLRTTIHTHPEFVAFAQQVEQRFIEWRAQHTPTLCALTVGAKPKRLIRELGEDLLQRFADLPLLSNYDLYQDLMTYWANVMQDDVYLIASDGWGAGNRLSEITGEKTKPEITLGKKKFVGELIPVPLVIARYFAAEQQAVNELQVARDEIARQLEELEETYGGASEHGGDVETQDFASLLSEAKTDKDKITKASINKRLKEIQFEAEADDERQVLNQYLALLDQEAAASKKVREAQAALDRKVIEKYPALTENEIKTLVIDDKWMTALSNAVKGEIERAAQTLTARIQELSERYATPLPQLSKDVDALTAKVDEHLRKMGYVWN